MCVCVYERDMYIHVSGSDVAEGLGIGLVIEWLRVRIRKWSVATLLLSLLCLRVVDSVPSPSEETKLCDVPRTAVVYALKIPRELGGKKTSPCTIL